ncbi:MAG: VanZ family protein [Desulfarculaceae bacterium]|nr:VanZ family protein [Desulfarculaceae bacterium]MCF8066444.1 VanZ family protein [Desulfarculaceae bacterium]MCF8099681.1 VanZ family protein [Desulfarculaceae bacterium]MCF8124021.1 VanZ family protein [Desulfarculaceae bacterium]
MPQKSRAWDLALCLAWVGLIFLGMYYGRALGPWFRGARGVWAMLLLTLAGLGFMAWVVWRVRRLPAPSRAGKGLGAVLCLVGLGLVAWWQPLLIERSHLVLYGVLGILAWRVAGHWTSGASRLIWAGACCALVGLADEVAQYFHPQRVFDPRDILTNALSAWLAMAAVSLLSLPRFHRG